MSQSGFFAYVLSACSVQLNIQGKGTTFQELSSASLGAFPLPLPPFSEQSAIVAFLDRETGKIDALVAEQERLIALLKEKRQAVISQAVTKGLDPGVPMKPSGVEWLGEVPAHWTIVPLKWLTDPDRPIMYGIVLPGPDVGEGVPILKGGNVRPSRMNLDFMARTTPEIEAPYARARLKGGDLVYSIRGSIGDCEFVPVELEGSNITQDVARVAIDGRSCAAWSRWALLASAVRDDLVPLVIDIDVSP
jgi:type I restriction enzyme S subunit